jgi:hypothetical protein
MNKYKVADLHCHPNLKTFGHSFSRGNEEKYDPCHVWFYDPPTAFTKALNAFTGLTKFRQADFTTLHKGGVRIAFVSFYPFEKGFFISGNWNGPFSARLANLVTGIGYKRVRYLQRHTDYFTDLSNEYTFFSGSCNSYALDGKTLHWKFARDWDDVERILHADDTIAVIPSIEGAHVLNTGLSLYGRPVAESEVLENIQRIKQWKYPPFFITFAHNFNNDLCGHARSLERLGKMADQFENLDGDFSPLGLSALHLLLSGENGSPVYIDIKHMSLKARLAYQEIVRSDYRNKVPIIVSHGAVTGINIKGEQQIPYSDPIYSTNDINFFDEELVNIARSGGVFALQLDGNRLASRKYLKKPLGKIFNKKGLSDSSHIVWMQLQHLAEVLDRYDLNAWGTMTIGSDFDGTINPLNGIWTAENLPALADQLLLRADQYLKKTNRLTLPENKNITAEEVVERFMFGNAVSLLKNHYHRSGVKELLYHSES